MTTVWVDATHGASGDMLLGALLGAGVPLSVLQDAVDAVSPEPVALAVEDVHRGGFAASRCHVRGTESHHHRTWADVRALLDPLDEPVRALAHRTFERLAIAEAAVHGTTPDEVHFHEVGALDSIADVVGVCAGFAHLGATEVVVSTVAVGSGLVRGAHGAMPVPPPAVTELLRGTPSYAGPAGHPDTELCTPTGAALLTALATAYGPQPPMTTDRVGVGAGGRDPEGYANVLRLLVGADGGPGDMELVLETNVDDLDPRVWPGVLEALLAAGAKDAWLTPILMKKGRPAHTLHVLTAQARAAGVRDVVFRHTTAIGLREHAVTKRALPREIVHVHVDGERIAVKVSRHEDAVTVQPEWDDVAAAAAALGRPAVEVLAAAHAAAVDWSA